MASTFEPQVRELVSLSRSGSIGSFKHMWNVAVFDQGEFYALKLCTLGQGVNGLDLRDENPEQTS